MAGDLLKPWAGEGTTRWPEIENDGVETGGVAATCPCLPGVGVAISVINDE